MLVAKVTGPDGQPLAGAEAELVGWLDGAVTTLGTGSVREGVLTIDVRADPGIPWGVRVDGRAVVAVPVAVTAEQVDLGTLVMLKSPIEWTVFHAVQGKVYGLPLAVAPGEAEPAAAPAEAPPETALPRSMSFGDIFGSTAQQIGSVLADPRSGLTLTAANVTLKGVPTESHDAVGLQFPTQALAAGGTGLSELSFSLRPRVESGDSPYASTNVRVPDLLGYTRELATRKAAAAGLLPEVSHEIVGDPAEAGRVVRQLPSGGKTLPPGEVVRLFVGRNEQG